MDLPDDIYREVTGGAKPLPQVGEAEQRTVPRMQVAMVVTLVRLNDKHAKPMTATVRDLSTRGVGLEFSEPMKVNDPFAIRLPRKNGAPPVWVQCQATRWSPIDGKLYAIGAKFTSILAPAKSADAAGHLPLSPPPQAKAI